ncbi:hypothetical protein AB834_01370 [PVC group bacterium (ex Bugula neritina AB1)]|nr:hypothetical protein AB834_01370 [PVC group bacterium (ex Bugula neritina AB1)]
MNFYKSKTLTRGLRYLGSLRVTVVCLLFLMILTIAGTLYQVEEGLYMAQQKVFYSWVFIMGDKIPFPGVRLVLWVLFSNLAMVFVQRFRMWYKSWALLITHLGVLFLFVAAFGKFHWGEDTYLTLNESQESNQVESYMEWELIFWEDEGDSRLVHAVDLEEITDQKMFFFEESEESTKTVELKLTLYYENCLAYTKGPMMQEAPYRNDSEIIHLEPKILSKEQETNRPGILLEIKEKDKAVETILLHGEESKATQINIQGKTFFCELRKKRYFLPFSVKLKDVAQGLYPGTDIPEHYQSKVVINDGSFDREVEISMNKPLRWKEYTVFQASYAMDVYGGEISTFAVSYNPFRLFPYIACLLIVLGLILHFLKRLLRYTRFFMILLFFQMSWASMSVQAEKVKIPEEAIEVWGRSPVLEEGRLKPLDSFARNKLLQFSGKSKYGDMSASEWLLRVVTLSESMNDALIFQIDNPQLVSSLGIRPRQRRRYSFKMLQEKSVIFQRIIQKIQRLEESRWNTLDREYLRVWHNMGSYMQLQKVMLFAQPSKVFDVEPSIEKYLNLPDKLNEHYSFYEIFSSIGILKEKIKTFIDAPAKEWTQRDRDTYDVLKKLFEWVQTQKDSSLKWIHLSEDLKETEKNDSWCDIFSLLKSKKNYVFVQPLLESLFQAYVSAQSGDWSSFSKYIKRFQNDNMSRWNNPAGIKKLSLERLYTRWDLMKKVKIFYICLMCFYFLLFLFPSKLFYKMIFFLTVATVMGHSFALLMRILILSRPPVSTLYETFIFVSLIIAYAGIILEFFHKRGLALLMVHILGFILMSIAGRYASDGDTFKVLQAVLNSNFWLSTHVIIITMGYALCLFAGFMGHLYLFQDVILKKSQKEMSSFFGSLYGTLAAGLIFSFLGTILGGIWADQSWGRFWGWDPKENGALLIVLWCTTIFHARLGGIIKNWGVAAACSLLPVFVALAWFGINLLGVGLHSYGFTEGVAKNLYYFIFFEVAFILFMFIKKVR